MPLDSPSPQGDNPAENQRGRKLCTPIKNEADSFRRHIETPELL
jgi:hypothetical protein